MAQNLQLHKPGLWADLVQRCQWAIRAFQAPRLQPQVELGGGVVFDLERRTLVLPADYHIESEGNLTIGAREHLMFFSGRNAEARPGYINSIWFNPDLDLQGLPLKDEEVVWDAELINGGCDHA